MKSKNFTTALRHISRFKTYSVLNLLGLAFGLASAMLIIVWIDHEVNVDKFHEKGDNIYQIFKKMKFTDGQESVDPSMTSPLGPTLVDELPEVEAAIRTPQESDLLFKLGERAFFEEGFYADTNFFRVFSFDLVKGDPSTVLKDPNSVVISEKLAQKYFKDKEPVGKTIEIQVEDIELFTVSGVFKEVKSNSSIQFDFVIPFAKYYEHNKDWLHWGNWSMNTYVSVKPGTDIQQLNKKINVVLKKYDKWESVSIFLHPFKKVYLYNDFRESITNPSGRILLVKIFSAVAVFILFLACMNYTNLATALATKRAKDVGVKKTFGSGRLILLKQFILESLILTIFALFVAFIIVELTLPFFNKFLQKDIQLNYLNFRIIGSFFLVTLLTGFFAGAFPAIFLSSFKPIVVLKNMYKSTKGDVQLRHILIITQFIITITFIISSFIISRQIRYIRNKSLGLDKDNVILFEQNTQIRKHREAFKEELMKKQGIISVTFISGNPLDIQNSTTDPSWRGKNPNDDFLISNINVDEDFIETFNIDIIEGRGFSKEYPSDTNCIIINQEFQEIMGFESPVGEICNYWGRKANIIGVIKNFHFNSLYIPIDNLMLIYRPRETWLVAVKIKGNMTKEAIKNVETAFRDFEYDVPFTYKFLDEEYAKNYEREKYTQSFSGIFSVLAIFISCLGLFGLSLFTAEQRTKEIGIRKATGASTFQVMLLLARDFTKWIAVSFVISCLIAYYAMHSWLNNFAYKTSINWVDFILTGIIALIISLLTVSWQSYRAASKNPIESLRYE